MKKYLGIVKKKVESANGLDIRIRTKFSNSKSEIKQWMKLYPLSENILLNNSEDLEKFFMDFEDFIPMTKTEKIEAERLLEELMKDNT